MRNQGYTCILKKKIRKDDEYQLSFVHLSCISMSDCFWWVKLNVVSLYVWHDCMGSRQQKLIAMYIFLSVMNYQHRYCENIDYLFPKLCADIKVYGGLLSLITDIVITLQNLHVLPQLAQQCVIQSNSIDSIGDCCIE